MKRVTDNPLDIDGFIFTEYTAEESHAFEIIQRKSHPGFGEVNFKALFEVNERDQLGGGVI